VLELPPVKVIDEPPVLTIEPEVLTIEPEVLTIDELVVLTGLEEVVVTGDELVLITSLGFLAHSFIFESPYTLYLLKILSGGRS
jgi:hypothetical protein